MADLCIIGAGSGGLSLAAGAAQMGARVVLVEGDHMGGDCLNTGCVPSKALIATARLAEAVRGAGDHGLHLDARAVDFAAVMQRVGRVIDHIGVADSQARFEGLGCRVLRGWARFASPREVVVAGAAGDITVRARRIVIATGSHPVVPDVPGLDTVPYLTNETLFRLNELPRHLLVLGGGPIGIEMAQAFRRLGADVTVIEAARCLGREDAEAAELVLDRLRAEGVRFVTGAEAVRFRDLAPGVEAVLSDGRTVAGTDLLVAVGRRAALGRLDLAAGGVDHTGGGVTVTNSRWSCLRSVSNRRVYAVGDAVGQGQFTHLAAYHSGLVIRQAVLGLPASLRRDHIPRVTYTEPELAQIGPTEAEARAAHGAALRVARAGFDHNDRAITAGQDSGFVKLMILRGRLIGATVVGPEAGEVLAPLALAVSARMKVSLLASVVLPYPTLAEVAKRAAGAHFAPTLFGASVRRFVRLVQRLG